MKQFIIISLLMLAALFPVKGEEISPRAATAFKKTFPGASNVKWHEKGDRYEVFFKMQQVSVLAVYDEAGNLLKTRRTYSGQFLAPAILLKVQKKHASKIITGVVEVTTNDVAVYEITLKDKKYWYKIISDASGNLEVTEKFSRAENIKD